MKFLFYALSVCAGLLFFAFESKAQSVLNCDSIYRIDSIEIARRGDGTRCWFGGEPEKPEPIIEYDCGCPIKYQGEVWIKAIIDTLGNVNCPKVRHSEGLEPDSCAIECAKRMKFTVLKNDSGEKITTLHDFPIWISSDKIVRGGNLRYQNYIETKDVFPIELLGDYRKDAQSASLILEKNRLLELDSFQPIKGDFFDYLSNIELINRWDIFQRDYHNPYSYDYPEFLEERKGEMSMFYAGELELNEDYKSILILVLDGISSMYYTERDLFLINVLGDSVSSIVNISSYQLSEGLGSYSFTKKTSRDSYVFKEEPEIFNPNFAQFYEDFSKKTIYKAKFRFDTFGHLIMDK